MAEHTRYFRGMALASAFGVAACGGRVSRPVAETNPYDSQLSCAHLEAEKDVNVMRAHDLIGEQHNDINNDVGFLVFSPLFINLSGTEQTEMKAFAAREKVLGKLIAQKCVAGVGGAGR
jgi:hypothetical protein